MEGSAVTESDVVEAVVLFGRFPERGGTKTRLARELGDGQTLTLYRAMLADSAWKLGRIPSTLQLAVLSTSGPITRPPVDPLERDPFASYSMLSQQGPDFGARLAWSMERPFVAGAARAILIGADSPEIAVADLAAALAALESCDVVLGPATDGGYYLVGMSRFIPELFQDMVWSTETVLQQTLDKARALGLTTALAATHADIDYVEDLQAFAARRQSTPPDDETCPATDAWLRGALAGQDGPPLLKPVEQMRR